MEHFLEELIFSVAVGHNSFRLNCAASIPEWHVTSEIPIFGCAEKDVEARTVQLEKAHKEPHAQAMKRETS